MAVLLSLKGRRHIEVTSALMNLAMESIHQIKNHSNLSTSIFDFLIYNTHVHISYIKCADLTFAKKNEKNTSQRG